MQVEYPEPKFEWNFFWANRGHNLCDGHAGVMKRKLRQLESDYTLVTRSTSLRIFESEEVYTPIEERIKVKPKKAFIKG